MHLLQQFPIWVVSDIYFSVLTADICNSRRFPVKGSIYQQFRVSGRIRKLSVYTSFARNDKACSPSANNGTSDHKTGRFEEKAPLPQTERNDRAIRPRERARFPRAEENIHPALAGQRCELSPEFSGAAKCTPTTLRTRSTFGTHVGWEKCLCSSYLLSFPPWLFHREYVLLLILNPQRKKKKRGEEKKKLGSNKIIFQRMLSRCTLSVRGCSLGVQAMPHWRLEFQR